MVLTAIVGSLDPVGRRGLGALWCSGGMSRATVVMTPGYLCGRCGNRLAVAVGVRNRHRGRGCERGEHSREQGEQQRSGDPSMHRPQRRKAIGLPAPLKLSDLTQVGSGRRTLRAVSIGQFRDGDNPPVGGDRNLTFAVAVAGKSL